MKKLFLFQVIIIIICSCATTHVRFYTTSSVNISNDAHASIYIITPIEHEIIYGFPRITTVSWTPILNATNYQIFVECSSRPYDYSATKFSPIPCGGGSCKFSTTESSFTFNGVGKQVHRLKVIAKKRDEIIAESPWRYINYNN